jgi:hypothetical protein
MFSSTILTCLSWWQIIMLTRFLLCGTHFESSLPAYCSCGCNSLPLGHTPWSWVMRTCGCIIRHIDSQINIRISRRPRILSKELLSETNNSITQYMKLLSGTRQSTPVHAVVFLPWNLMEPTGGVSRLITGYILHNSRSNFALMYNIKQKYSSRY